MAMQEKQVVSSTRKDFNDTRISELKIDKKIANIFFIFPETNTSLQWLERSVIYDYNVPYLWDYDIGKFSNSLSSFRKVIKTSGHKNRILF